ncbi:hypothetical protein DEO72_LG10g2062 [Vigna unguiculata]|uniref:Uncharacterized protein n=1 Tax=Vigna unguiculata TaxID=3917 RepID=A0A4D6NAC4_VIGUN|nr:hypothetical protein DEO72_LG10g2062 [Vigna unguiculata]
MKIKIPNLTIDSTNQRLKSLVHNGFFTALYMPRFTCKRAAVSSLHHRSAVEQPCFVAQASSIVVVAEVAKPPPLSSFNLACRYGGEKRLFYVADEMNEDVVKLFRRDAVVEDGSDDTLAAFRV